MASISLETAPEPPSSRIWNYYGLSKTDISKQFIGIRVRNNADALIHNNLIYNCYDSHGQAQETDCGMGILLNPTPISTILSNVSELACFRKRALKKSG